MGEKEGDEPQFDPGVMTEGDKTWLYTGFCAIGDTSRTGPMGTVLGPDMLTILEGPVNIAPSQPYSKAAALRDMSSLKRLPSVKREIHIIYLFLYCHA